VVTALLLVRYFPTSLLLSDVIRGSAIGGPNSGISLNWSIIDEVTTRNTTAYFLAHSVLLSSTLC